MKENGAGYGLLTVEALRWFWEQYVPDAADRVDPRVSPMRAADLRGVAPAMVVTAEYDPLRDEGRAYAERLRMAGVPVVIKEYEGVIHGFVQRAGVVDKGKVAIMECAGALREASARAD